MMDYNPSDTGVTGTTQGICPAGWHIPTENEWETLAYDLGGLTSAGGPLKETGFTHWQSPNEGATNETGFTALPGGKMDRDDWENDITNPNDNKFYYLGTEAHFWASKFEYSQLYQLEFGHILYLTSRTIALVWEPQPTPTGESVRCIKDP
jgi:uncharacterized protein (TIGR02145 family)